MDSLITAAGRALAAGDPLGALKRVALRDDPPALALRGIAMAQLGDFDRARTLVRRAARGFGHREPLARARCVVAEAEIALAAREFGWPEAALDAARVVLEAHGDRLNAAHAVYLSIRRWLLAGRFAEAEQALGTSDLATLPPALRAVHELCAAGIAMRRIRAADARQALDRAMRAARQAGIPALVVEVAGVSRTMDAPAARLLADGAQRLLTLDQVESLLASGALVVDACRYLVRDAAATVSLATRPVLFVLAQALAEAWPADVSRHDLIARAFRTRFVDETYRARLRVEIGRLRKAVRTLADVRATVGGFQLTPRRATGVAVLARPVEEKHAAVLALLSDGEAWSSSALALALGTSQRQVQRALDALAAAGKVQPVGRGRARRWSMPPAPGFMTALLLPAPLPGD